MGSMSRRKGRRIELEVVHELVAAGVPARRRQASGDARSESDPDILIAETLTAEVKARKGGAGFATVEKWLGESDLLFCKANNRPMLVAMRLETFKPLLLAWAEQGKGSSNG